MLFGLFQKWGWRIKINPIINIEKIIKGLKIILKKFLKLISEFLNSNIEKIKYSKKIKIPTILIDTKIDVKIANKITFLSKISFEVLNFLIISII